MLALFFGRHIADPYRLRGDYTSDPHCLISARHFYEQGFGALYLLPVIKPGPLPSPIQYYTHYPPGPNLASGLMYELGWTTLQQQRRLPMLLSLVVLLLYYLALRAWSPTPLAAVGAALFVFAPAYLNVADSLHHYVYGEFARALGLLAMLRWLREPERRGGFLVAWLALFLAGITSFETTPFLFIFSVGMTVVVVRRPWREPLMLAGASAFAFALHLLQNALALGVHGMAADMKRIFLVRAFNVGSENWDLRFLAGQVARFTREMIGLHALEAALLIPLLAVVIALAREGRRGATWRLMTVIWLGALSWFFLFRNHLGIHSVFDARHLLVVLIPALVYLAAHATRSLRRRPRGLPAWLLLLYLFTVVGRMAVTDVRFATRPTVALWGQDIFADLGRVTPPTGVILTNIGVTEPLGQLAWRPVRRISNAGDLDPRAPWISEEFGAGRFAALYVYSVVGKTSAEIAADPVAHKLKAYPRTWRAPYLVYNLMAGPGATAR